MKAWVVKSKNTNRYWNYFASDWDVLAQTLLCRTRQYARNLRSNCNLQKIAKVVKVKVYEVKDGK